MNTQQGINWKAVLLSSILLIIISTILNTLIGIAYGLYVGFQTRGDQDAITQQVGQFSRSAPFLLISAIVLGALIFWRGRGFIRAAISQPLASLIIVIAITVIAGIAIGSTAGGIKSDTLIAQAIVQFAIATIAAYASTTRPAAKATATS
jgi:hypothetical protein